VCTRYPGLTSKVTNVGTEVKLSAFFALHRPISVYESIPNVSTNTSFDSIFKSREPGDRKTMMDNIQTISSGIERLESASRVPENQVPGEALRSKAEVDKAMSQLIPFVPPPVPTPRDQVGGGEMVTELVNETPISASVKQRAWSTEVVVTESTDATGQRTYSATTAPMVEISVPGAKNSQDEEFEIHQPFLQRMKQRQISHSRRRDNLGRPDMLAISVKRQRKLKMKKHKYKKLMKRTRLLRRKLDRL
jgi:hypothetical protein